MSFRHLHRFAAASSPSHTAHFPPQPILVVDVTVPGAALLDSSADVDACPTGGYSQPCGGRSLRGGLSPAILL